MVSEKIKMIIAAIIAAILIIALIILIIFLSIHDDHDDHSHTSGILISPLLCLKSGNVVQSLSDVAFKLLLFKNKFWGRIYLAELQDGVSLF